MKVIDPMIFYKYLITDEYEITNDLSLYAKNNFLDDSGNLKNHFDMEIFNQGGEWMEDQVNTMNTQNDISEKVYGNFRYISTVVDEKAMFPQYSEIFELQMIAPEKFREDIIKLMEDYSLDINNLETEFILDDNGVSKSFDVLIQLGELSTPVYSEKQDIGGMERFIIGLNFVVNVTTSIVTNKKIKLYNLNTTYEEDEIKYITLKIQRENELVIDNKAGEQKLYDSNKSDFTMSIAALYTGTEFSRKVMKYIMYPENLETPIKMHYRDESTPVVGINELGKDIYEIDTIFDLFISSADISYQFGQPVSFTVTLKHRVGD